MQDPKAICEILAGVLPPKTWSEHLTAAVTDALAREIPLDALQHFLERQYVAAVLYKCKGNQCSAAGALKMHRNTLGRHLRRLGLEPKPTRKIGPVSITAKGGQR